MKRFWFLLKQFFLYNIYLGRHPGSVPPGAVVFFPLSTTSLHCGIAGIVAVKGRAIDAVRVDAFPLSRLITDIEKKTFDVCRKKGLSIEKDYLGGSAHIRTLLDMVQSLKRNDRFVSIFKDKNIQASFVGFADRLHTLVQTESRTLQDALGYLEPEDAETVNTRIEAIKDIQWALTKEITENLKKIASLIELRPEAVCASAAILFKEINSVLNSIDRLEVRGRDSAGISVMLVLIESEYNRFEENLKKANRIDPFAERLRMEILLNRGIHVHRIRDERKGHAQVTLTFTYKVAAEIGSLGDNVAFLRNEIRNDPIFQEAALHPFIYHSVLSHTRWASVGAITEANCCPQDNHAGNGEPAGSGLIYVCLNGDIDNYLELKKEFEENTGNIHPDITTDTKIIPLQIEKYCREGIPVEDAFRLAVNDFTGSHAIAMHSSLAPGKIFLAQRGSGQALFIGVAADHYMAVSEVYGSVEETGNFLKVNGNGAFGGDGGQIYVLSQQAAGELDGIRAMNYDGTPVKLTDDDIRRTEITTRDIDRRGYAHYFLKEISESPASVEKTLQNRWRIGATGRRISLDESVIPQTICNALSDRKIRRIYFIGQGTAGVAALACANILTTYLDDPDMVIGAMKASELSGFSLNARAGENALSDTLVVAISQSGTTTDTNRTVDMVKAHGAHTIAIVNRRDSDLTFKVDGVMYTSSGRDIEMSVASTKAFYAQIVAGALLGLAFARMTGKRDDVFVSNEIGNLLTLPERMRSVLRRREKIELSARRLASQRTYWAAVGSGPNKASADEIRIKLSELCYKTISSDFVEDKKHIDLSSEPLIIVCAAGTRDTVIGDIVKDTAIFKAHKALPVVIADEGEHRFDPYAEDVFHVPSVPEHLAPVLNTLAGHIWGYYAALAIHEGSRMLFRFQQEIQQDLEQYARQGLDINEVVLEKSFREKIVKFYLDLRSCRNGGARPTAITMASDLALALKYLAGRLPVSDFEIDFGKKGTALNMLNTLFELLAEAVNRMSRPIDAIKHQAKTVTVGTSRIGEKVEGILFDALMGYNLDASRLSPGNVIVLRNLQEIIARVNGSILYRIDSLSLLGEPTEETTIRVEIKEGILKNIPSRVERDPVLKGTKRIVVKEGNIYIGQGRSDGRSILIVPISPDKTGNSNRIEYLLLLNISFKQKVALPVRIRALGGKYERIKNTVLETGLSWNDAYLESVDMKVLFGHSAEKIAEQIVPKAA